LTISKYIWSISDYRITEAIQQLQLATDQMGTLTGVSVQSNDFGGNNAGESGNDGESDDNGEESEEGPGEDADEPGDTDQNDEED
jgi:hypothetical protein